MHVLYFPGDEANRVTLRQPVHQAKCTRKGTQQGGRAGRVQHGNYFVLFTTRTRTVDTIKATCVVRYMFDIRHIRTSCFIIHVCHWVPSEHFTS